MRKTQTHTLAEAAYTLIKNDIVMCAFDPGQFIAQAELAEKYAVGLTPVREALRQLSQEGFVQSVPRMGYIVSQITPQDVQEIYELRLILESSSVRLAASRALDSALDGIAQLANTTYTYKDRESYSRFLNQNANFHVSIATATGNKRLAFQISKTMDELNRVFHLGLDLRDSAVEMRQDHLALVDALRRRAPDLAEQRIQAEIQLSRERVMEALKRYPNSSALKGEFHGETTG